MKERSVLGFPLQVPASIDPTRSARAARGEKTVGAKQTRVPNLTLTRAQTWNQKFPIGWLLPLGDTARQLLDFLLRGAAGLGPLCLGSGLFAGGALQRFPFLFVFNLGGICHLIPLSLHTLVGFPQVG